MFCQSCGISNKDGALFCENCGAPLKTPAAAPTQIDEPAAEQPPVAVQEPAVNQNEEEIPAQQPDVGQTAYDTQMPPQPQTPPQPQAQPVYFAPTYNSVISATKRIGSGKKFLALAIILSIITGLSLLAQTFSANLIPQEFYDELAQYGQEMGNVSVNMFSVMPSMAIPILTVIGLWLVYAACKKQVNSVSASGFVILKVATIIELVFVCIAAVVSCACLVVIYSLTDLYKYDLQNFAGSVNISQILSVIGAVLIVVFALNILFYVKKLQTVNAVIDSVKTGIPSQKASSFYGVMVYLGGALLGLGGVIVLFGGMAVSNQLAPALSKELTGSTQVGMAFAPIIMIISIICAALLFVNAAHNFILGSLVFDFKNAMKEIKLSSDASFMQN